MSLYDQLSEMAYFDEVKRQQLAVNELERLSKEQAIQQKIDEIEKKKELNLNDKNEIENLKKDIAQVRNDRGKDTTNLIED